MMFTLNALRFVFASLLVLSFWPDVIRADGTRGAYHRRNLQAGTASPTTSDIAGGGIQLDEFVPWAPSPSGTTYPTTASLNIAVRDYYLAYTVPGLPELPSSNSIEQLRLNTQAYLNLAFQSVYDSSYLGSDLYLYSAEYGIDRPNASYNIFIDFDQTVTFTRPSPDNSALYEALVAAVGDLEAYRTEYVITVPGFENCTAVAIDLLSGEVGGVGDVFTSYPTPSTITASPTVSNFPTTVIQGEFGGVGDVLTSYPTPSTMTASPTESNFPTTVGLATTVRDYYLAYSVSGLMELPPSSSMDQLTANTQAYLDSVFHSTYNSTYLGTDLYLYSASYGIDRPNASYNVYIDFDESVTFTRPSLPDYVALYEALAAAIGDLETYRTEYVISVPGFENCTAVAIDLLSDDTSNPYPNPAHSTPYPTPSPTMTAPPSVSVSPTNAAAETYVADYYLAYAVPGSFMVPSSASMDQLTLNTQAYLDSVFQSTYNSSYLGTRVYLFSADYGINRPNASYDIFVDFDQAVNFTRPVPDSYVLYDNLVAAVGDLEAYRTQYVMSVPGFENCTGVTIDLLFAPLIA